MAMTFGWFRRVVRGFKLGPIWMRAREKAAEKDYLGAKAELDHYSEAGGPHDVAFLLLYTFVMIRIGDASSLRDLIEMARESIHDDDRYSSNEKNYMHCYCDILTGLASDEGVDVNDLELRGKWSALDRNAVRYELKMNHPISEEAVETFTRGRGSKGS